MVEFEKITFPGSRNINEDSLGTACNGSSLCFVVADGLGGHGGGQDASRIAVEAACNRFATDGWSNHFFEDVFQQAQQNILIEQERQHCPSRMKTTMVMLVLHEGMATWAHIGDSRLYFFKNGKLKLRTLDHSVPQMLVLSREIKEPEIRHHPDRNRLLRVLGLKGVSPRYDTYGPIKLIGTTTFLLCTDGFWELVEETDMVSCLKDSCTLKEWMDKLKDIIEANGSGTDMDNYTGIAVQVKCPRIFGR